MPLGPFPILYIAEADPEAAVLSSGVLAHLADVLPKSSLTVVASPESAPLFEDVPRRAETILMEGEGPQDWMRLWLKLRKVSWGLVVDMRGSRLSDRLKRQKRAIKGPPEPGVHAAEWAARALQLDETPAPKLFLAPERHEAAEALIGKDAGPILAVGPGAAWLGKQWPAERFAKVAAALLGADGPLAGGRLMIVGGEDDRDAARTVRMAVDGKRAIELQGKLGPLETAAALSRARLFIGGDSIWTQLAVAAGTPSVGVFGPSDDGWSGPWGGVSVRGPRTVEEYRQIDPGLNQAIQHMMDLPADRVTRAAKALLAQTLLAKTGEG
jgi:heptosyltransferase-3